LEKQAKGEQNGDESLSKPKLMELLHRLKKQKKKKAVSMWLTLPENVKGTKIVYLGDLDAEGRITLK
jgi:hypothetical protein